MGFFTTDFGLGEEYANPKVSQTYQPSGGAGATSPALTSRQAASDPLGQLAKAMGGNTSGGYGASGTNPLTNITNMLAGSSNMVGGGLGGFAPTSPITPINQTPISGDSGGDYSSGITQGGDSYQALQDYLNTGPVEQGILSSVFGMMGIPKSALTFGHGIKPWGGTLPWYAGSTTYEGDAISDAQASLAGGMFSGFGSQYESDISDMFGWGSDEHFAAIEESFPGYTAPPVIPWEEYVVDSGDSSFTEMATGEYGEAGFTQEEADFASSFDDDSDYSDDGDYGGYGDDSDDGGDGWSGDDFGW